MWVVRGGRARLIKVRAGTGKPRFYSAQAYSFRATHSKTTWHVMEQSKPVLTLGLVGRDVEGVSGGVDDLAADEPHGGRSAAPGAGQRIEDQVGKVGVVGIPSASRRDVGISEIETPAPLDSPSTIPGLRGAASHGQRRVCDGFSLM